MSTNQKLTHGEAINEIEGLCATHKSGTLYLVTETNVMAQIMFTEGNIVAIQCGRDRRMPALETIRQSRYFTTFKFKEHNRSSIKREVNQELLPTPQILKILNNDEQDNNKKMDLTEITKAVATELTQYIGPIASVISNDYLKDVAKPRDIRIALDKLAEVIEDAADKEKFKRLLTELVPDNT